MPKYPDPAIEEVRRVRHEISSSADHDVRKLAERLKKLESQFKRPPLDYGSTKTEKVKRLPSIEPEAVA